MQWIKTGDERAVVLVDSDGFNSISSWYEIWEAVNTIAYSCVRAKNKGGRFTQIGEQ